MPTQLIDTPAALETAVEALATAKVLAVDTEFVRETTYYPQLGLVQIASDTHCFCIDPLALDARDALRRLFLDTHILKVFHSCSQDLEVLHHHYGFVPAPLHDTQFASALLGEHDQTGYARLLLDELGIGLEKSETRTNWLKRPLSVKQIEYAGDDVRYLHPLYHHLIERLKQAGRLDWFLEDCQQRLPQTPEQARQLPATLAIDMDSVWKRVKGAQRLNGQPLAVVQAIARWREQLAIETDNARRRILHDDRLIRLAMKPPASLGALRAQLRDNRFRLDGKALQQLFEAIEQARQLPPEAWPDNPPYQADAERKAALKALQQAVSRIASELGLAATTLCSRRQLEKLLDGETRLEGWRKDVLKEIVESRQLAV